MPDQPDIVKRLRAELTDTLHIDLRLNPIKIKTEGDAIIMEGNVEGIRQKKRGLLIAMGLEGVSGVIDRLRVLPASHMGDREIAAHIRNAFTEEPTLDASNITLEVSNGVVDIEGEVGSLTHKRLAGVLVWWVPGVVEVINSLEVEPGEEDRASEVTDAIRIVLEKDRLVDESSIKVVTEDCVVRLSGAVKSEEQKEAAEDDAWYVWGVNDVINELEVVSAP
jgi:osmotically-inducible protein OsmY